MSASQPPPADWYPDPSGGHQHRYWDGDQWTEHVADDGVSAVDPLPAAPPVVAETTVMETTDVPTVAEPGPDGPAAAGPAAAEPAPAGTGWPAGAEPTPAGTGWPAGGAAVPMQPSATGLGITTDLLSDQHDEEQVDRVGLQNRKMLKVVLGPDVLARQGSMVAYQGALDFDHEGAGVARFLKKAVTGEGVPLMRVTGTGELFLASDADDVHIISLAGGALTVNGRNLLAFEPSLDWDIERVKGVGVLAGGLFNTTLRGTGWVAITSHGTPVTLVVDRPTFADVDAAIAWSASLSTSIHRTVKVSALIGRGSGEVAQLAFAGQGFVVVQASEGPSVPPHSHSS